MNTLDLILIPMIYAVPFLAVLAWGIARERSDR